MHRATVSKMDVQCQKYIQYQGIHPSPNPSHQTLKVLKAPGMPIFSEGLQTGTTTGVALYATVTGECVRVTEVSLVERDRVRLTCSLAATSATLFCLAKWVWKIREDGLPIPLPTALVKLPNPEQNYTPSGTTLQSTPVAFTLTQVVHTLCLQS